LDVDIRLSSFPFAAAGVPAGCAKIVIGEARTNASNTPHTLIILFVIINYLSFVWPSGHVCFQLTSVGAQNAITGSGVDRAHAGSRHARLTRDAVAIRDPQTRLGLPDIARQLNGVATNRGATQPTEVIPNLPQDLACLRDCADL
jgi:hypothetical protein